MKKKIYTGINIQHPISQLILEGKKIVETRTYEIPTKYVGCEMAMIETPGPNGDFKARVVAIVTFGTSFRYQSEKEFYKDTFRHCVSKNSKWSWDKSKEKWGWPILKIQVLSSPIQVNKKKGIKFTNGIQITS